VQEYDYEAQRKAAAAGRSFTSPAIITLILYFVLWIPGLIANIVFWREAKRVEKLIGRSPEGLGCLTWMLVVFIGIPVVVVILLMVTGGLAGILD
jgi:uncharacterized protein involved in cysteine biosynthesis